MFDNSDEYDFTPADSSKLAQLFGNVGQMSDDSNSSLMYTAPKQPNNQKVNAEDDFASSKNKSQSTVLLAKVVSLWKLENKEYKALGKHGLAVIGAVDLNLFEIIAYKEKNNVILRTKVNDTLLFYHQKDDFSSFYDENSKNWLIKFQKDDQKQFCEVIEKFGAQIIGNELGPSQKSSDTVISKPEVLPKPKFDSENSETQTDSSGSQQRAQILSRMAKMGQQILPKPPLINNSSDISDSELEQDRLDRKLSSRKLKKHTEKPSRGENELLKNPDNRMLPTTTNSIIYPPNFNQNVLSPMIYAQPTSYEGFNHFLISQNAELKMSIAQISAKLDNVLSVPIQKNDDSALKSKIKALELKSANLQEALSKCRDDYNLLEKKYSDLTSKDQNESTVIINGLESEIAKLKLNLTVAEDQLDDFENLKYELLQSKNDIKDCERTIEIQKLKMKDYEDFYEKNKYNRDLQSTIDSLNDTVMNLNLKLKDYEEYFERNESEKQERQKKNNEKINLLSDMIKIHMNEMYQSVLKSFSEGDSIQFSNIQSEVAKNLKGTTFRIIEDLKTIQNEGANAILKEH